LPFFGATGGRRLGAGDPRYAGPSHRQTSWLAPPSLPALQLYPGAQSVVTLHPTVHAALTQACGVQSVVAPATHLPAPSHVEVPTRMEVLPDLQALAAQVVPAG